MSGYRSLRFWKSTFQKSQVSCLLPSDAQQWNKERIQTASMWYQKIPWNARYHLRLRSIHFEGVKHSFLWVSSSARFKVWLESAVVSSFVIAWSYITRKRITQIISNPECHLLQVKHSAILIEQNEVCRVENVSSDGSCHNDASQCFAKYATIVSGSNFLIGIHHYLLTKTFYQYWGIRVSTTSKRHSDVEKNLRFYSRHLINKNCI